VAAGCLHFSVGVLRQELVTGRIEEIELTRKEKGVSMPMYRTKKEEEMKNRIIIFLFIAVLLIPFSANAKEKMPESGFLGDYSGFKPGPSGGADWVYFKKDIEFGKYKKVMFDQVTFYLKKDAKDKGIQPEDIKELTEAFDNAVRENIGKYYPLVDQPGPDVLRIRVAITDLVPNKPGMSAVSTVMPIGLGISIIKKAVTGKHTGVGETGMEMEALDSLTNQRIAAAIDWHSGGKLAGMKKWGSAEEAFKFWTERIKMRLDEYREKK
jgi:hypothetical protein